MQPNVTQPRPAFMPRPAGLGSSRVAAGQALGCEPGNVRWTKARARDVVRKLTFAYRNHPAQLAALKAELLEDLDPDVAALPSLEEAVFKTAVDDAEVLAETAEFHRTASLASKERLLRSLYIEMGDVTVEIAALKASIQLQKVTPQ
jgi:hypothetical protein